MCCHSLLALMKHQNLVLKLYLIIHIYNFVGFEIIQKVGLCKIFN